MTPLRVCHLGLVPYLDVWALQKQLAQERGADHIANTLLLLEHPHTYTLGSAGHPEYILLSPAELETRHIEVHRVDRGGDVTYHGPGQLVGYPIFRLPPQLDKLHADVIDYIRRLEQAIIAALATFGITGWPYAGLTGVWVGDHASPAKICAIGVKITTKRVTFHGFALNVNTDMSYFEGIVPCGIHDKAVSSMQQLLGKPIAMSEVESAIIHAIATEFGSEVISEQDEIGA
jgi:lipoyl(octanoyl) transferase